jgi:polyribonucleotide nucleotidyltransferase
VAYVRESATLGDKEIIIETGRMAKQAGGSVLIQQGETMVLVTAVGGPERKDISWFPLVCDYVEKTYAAGRIPGSFFRREGRLGDHEILASRCIDRPCRPLFPDGYRGDTQITATVLSHDQQNRSDVIALTGASTALMLSDIPWRGPIAGIRVARVDGNFIANPTVDQMEGTDMDLVMACSLEAIVMLEGEAQGISEGALLDAMDFARESTRRVLDMQVRLQEAVGKTKREFTPPVLDPKVLKSVTQLATDGIVESLAVRDKLMRYKALDAVKASVKEQLAEKFADQSGDISEAFEKVKKQIARSSLAQTGKRIDGRAPADIRQITTEVSVLPRTHGSCLFTRGETQALVTCTFGTQRMDQKQETLLGETFRRFMLHYNFPPFSVGEVKMLRGPGRREVGHGILARRALEQMIPSQDVFPYTIRLVSEVLESNGSSSMATVCGGSMALMDAGVPIMEPVAGIAMGLIKEDDKIFVLSDILGDEDHMGDMDFKVTGTRNGINSVQMDTKIAGISREIMETALEQARAGRIHILDEMDKTLDMPRGEMSPHAPRIVVIKVKPDRIRDVIGAGGKNIRGIVEATGVDINVEDDGSVSIASADQEACDKAIDMVRGLTAEPEVGAIYLGIVARVVDFGAFVTILPNLDGLCHISELSEERVGRTTDVLQEGDEVVVKCIGLERGGKVKLSRKAALGQKPTISALEGRTKKR